MSQFAAIEKQLTETLQLRRRPVAVSFCDSAPANIRKFEGTLPSGCSFWRIAAEGGAFYTVPADHYNCPVGSYTHNIELPPARANELTQVLGFMTEAGYLKMEEVPGIPRLPKSPAAIGYAPLGEATLPPDVVILAGRPGKLSLLQEAAIRAGVQMTLPLLARPTCMSLPAALQGGAVMSTACIGNRTYTDLADDELYMTVRGADLPRISAELATIAAANAQLAAYHLERRKSLATQ